MSSSVQEVRSALQRAYGQVRVLHDRVRQMEADMGEAAETSQILKRRRANILDVLDRLQVLSLASPAHTGTLTLGCP